MKVLASAALRTFPVKVFTVLPHPWVMPGFAGEAHAGICATGAALEVVAEFSVQDASGFRIAGLA